MRLEGASMKTILPEQTVAVNKCAGLYNSEEMAALLKENRKNIILLYLADMVFALISLILDGFQAAMPFLLILLVIYKMRYASIENRIKKDRQGISDALPLLMDRVVLLLSAGMYIEGALEKIATDFAGDNFLFAKLSEMLVKSRQSNKSIIFELSDFSVNAGLRELIRFSNILENNFNMGSDLIEKLEAEGALLWNDRIKRTEEKARKAETKLSFPLMLLLISLITITSAPMLMSI